MKTPSLSGGEPYQGAWILGDLNISEESAKDLASGSAESLAELLDQADLVDVATFFDAALEHTRVATIGSRVDARRLDRILLPSGFCDRVTQYQTVDYAYSDHRAVLIQVGDPAPTRLPCIGKLLRSDLFVDRMETFIDEISVDLANLSPPMLWEKWTRIKANLVAEIRSLAPAVAESGGGYIERASLFLRRRLEDDTARSDYPSLSDLGRFLRARRRSPSTFTDDDGNVISGGQLRRFLLERLSSRFAQAPSSEEAIADFLAEVTPLEFDEWDQLFLADISRDQIAAAIHRLPNGRASGWDGLPCEFVKAFEDFFAEFLWQVFEASRLRGALPPSSRRSKVILLPKVHGGPGLQAFRPISLPTTDYRVLSGVLMARLRRHLPDLVPQCQTYAVPGRSSSWNIARVSDEAAGASRHVTPLAVISLDLKSAFDTLSRSYLFALLEKLGLPSTFLGWIAVLYGEADASIRVGDVYTKAFPLLNGVRQGCRLSAALFSIGVGPLLRRLERTLGRGNVVAYADDIVLFIRDDAQFELVPLIFEEFRMSSGVAINFKKSCGLWCGSWKHRTDSPLGISWTSESLTVLGCTITTRNTVASQASHLMGLLERAIARWSPFTRGLSLVGRARAANSLVLGSILHHLHGYLPPETTVGRLQARLARFVWGTSRVSWLPGRILARPVSDGGVGLLDIAGQLRLACLKGVQASLRGAANGYSWLVRSRAWLTPPAPDVWHSPRRRRLLSLWEAASSVLELDHRVLHPACLRSLRLRGDNRFLRPPDLLAPERWLQATVGDFSDGAPALARSTRAALLDAQHLGAFCQRLLRENASSSYHAEYEAETIVLRGSATPITRLPSQRARRALDSARLQAHPTAELAARWTPTVDVPRSIPWADLRRNCFSGHDADVALRLALHALPHPDHPASRRANCAACGSSDGSLAHRYWSCRAVRTLLREVFASCDLPLDLQAWLFGVGLHPEAVKLTSVAKATIYKYHLGLELDSFQEKPPKKTTAIFLDMTSAFDRVWREKLREKLHNIRSYQKTKHSEKAMWNKLGSKIQNSQNNIYHLNKADNGICNTGLGSLKLITKNPPFSENEVKLTAFKFGKRKSPGPEGIDNTVVKALVRMHPSLLSRLFNRCLDTGTSPEAWKVTRVVLLEKFGRKGKVLDSLLAQRLKHWLESNELLSSFQNGFREGKSTTTALNEVLEGVEMGLNKGVWVLFVALDIDGAFNSMSWNKLMRNLMDMGCPDNLCSLVRDLLRDRRISLSFGGRKLERNCARGCPQGSCCGPILWNILVNTVFQEELPEGARLVLYADDQFLIIEAASRAKAEKVVRDMGSSPSLHRFKIKRNPDCVYGERDVNARHYVLDCPRVVGVQEERRRARGAIESKLLRNHSKLLEKAHDVAAELFLS
ncbi:hypothetical protein LAZ67_3002155 [Cordylochernes scorpioides]|uniref:Reverse transcriptase domain-containing protein n=1 Tax=Cordylochernes scorpioides TaxID=51811 RepID=A0ABY6K7S1_9ARAC|nr:hypothetical protein LAZ67_3002155 [Cordylochernes scorpioides]